MEEIIIMIGQDGSAEVKAQCIKGKACKDVTKAIEKAIGQTTKDVETSEMREVAHAKSPR